MFPTRFVNLPEARAQFGDRVDRLGAYLTRVDPLADAVVTAMEAMPPGAGRALFRRAAQGGIASLTDAPQALRAFFADGERGGLEGRGPLGGVLPRNKFPLSGLPPPGRKKAAHLERTPRGAGGPAAE